MSDGFRTRIDIAAHLMAEFAHRTGLDPPARQPQRYLWTDSFAVCNFLELHRRAGAREALAQAQALIDQVHHVLGRFRSDDPRRGWLSGLADDDGERHPTAGGLRIGKPLPERSACEPLDERREWDRDGQYFHYLTKWMHALCQAAWVTGEIPYARWAGELGQAAFDGFVRRAGSGALVGVTWKMSTDLSRPLVPSMGLHDALDGYLSLREIRHALAAMPAPDLDPAPAAEALHALCVDRDWKTDDPLGLGGLLFDAARLCQFGGVLARNDMRLLDDLLADCAQGLTVLLATRQLTHPAAHRLAFRELGLAIGLRALPIIAEAAAEAARPLRQFQNLGDDIVAFWLSQAERADAAWRAHYDINAVMLATALVPDTFLAIGRPR
jgi:hypothetical protein